MRRQIAWVVAATTSAVVLVFVIPLALLVQSLAEDRGMAAANEEARNIAVLVSGLHDSPSLPDLVLALDERSPAASTVLTASGATLGAEASDMATDPDVLRARDSGAAFTLTDDDGARIFVPVVTAAGTEVVRTTVPQAVLREGVTRAWLVIGLLGLGLFVVAVAVADRLGRRVSTPVTDLASVAHRLREGELDARATPSGPPETTELGEALNRLAERITELLAAERAAVGDLSHRLRTPLTALRLDAEAVADPRVADRLQEHVGNLQRTVDAIVKDARRPVRSAMPAACDATQVVRDRVAFWTALAEDQQRPVMVQLPERPLWVQLDAVDLRDMVDVLVDNVFAHTPEGTALTVSLSRGSGRPELEVSDEGPGIGSGVPQAADRTGFSGLGLQIVRRTVHASGGDLLLGSRPGGGTRVRVLLPPAAPGAHQSPSGS